MKALIDPTTQVQYVSSWTAKAPYKPIFSVYANSARICQTQETEFPVAEPLFWIDCSDTISADEYYYDLLDQEIKPIVNAPYPSA
jgi:hypothetical protein